MRTGLGDSFRHELFSAEEIAAAAGVAVHAVRAILDSGRVVSFRHFVAPADAAALVRRLSKGAEETAGDRAPITTVPPAKRRSGLSLAVSGLLHGMALIAIAWATILGLNSNDTEQDIRQLPPAHIVFLVTPGPGGGGGGGGLQMAALPPQAMRKAPAPTVKKVSSPVVRVQLPPPRRSTARLPRPVDPPRPAPKPIDTPKLPPQVVQAPVVPAPADPVDTAGLLAAKTAVTSGGPGLYGGLGTGAGTGTGEGDGAGIGAGTGGGTGGGPYRPGTGIEPPTVVREVRPTYTDEARRRSITGDVVLEIVVLRDGRVGNVRVLRSLGAGLDQRATDAVRQWRFNPARRQGVPVDVLVEVSVEFKLR